LQNERLKNGKLQIGPTNLQFHFAICNRQSMDRAIQITLLVAIAFTALAFGTVEAWSVAIFELLVVVIMLMWVVKSLAERRLEINVPKTALPIIGLVVYGVIQGLGFSDSTGRIKSLSMDVESTRAAVTVIFFLLICFLASSNFFRTPDQLQTLMKFLVVFGAGLAVFSLVQHFTWGGRIYWLRQTRTETVGPFVNRNHFAGYMEMLIPFPVGLLVARGIRPDLRALYAFAAIIMTVALIASLSRGGIVSLAAGLAAIAIAARPLTRRTSGGRLVRASIAAAVLVGFGTALFWIGPAPIIDRASATIDQRNEDRHADRYYDRQWIWSDTLSMWKASPLTGIGLGAFPTVYPVYGHCNDSMIVPAAHNDYLQVLADGGVVGGVLLICFVVFVSQAVFGGLRASASEAPDRFRTGMALGGAAAILAMLVHSIFDFNLQLPSNALLFLVITATVSTIGGKPAQSRQVSKVRKEVRVVS
jgi:O-antigen ligase